MANYKFGGLLRMVWYVILEIVQRVLLIECIIFVTSLWLWFGYVYTL